MSHQLQPGDKVIGQIGHYSPPFILTIARVTATQAKVGDYIFRREVESHDYVKEVGPNHGPRREFRLGTPARLAEATKKIEFEEAITAAETRMDDARKKLLKASVPALKQLTADLLRFIDNPTAG